MFKRFRKMLSSIFNKKKTEKNKRRKTTSSKKKEKVVNPTVKSENTNSKIEKSASSKQKEPVTNKIEVVPEESFKETSKSTDLKSEEKKDFTHEVIQTADDSLPEVKPDSQNFTTIGIIEEQIIIQDNLFDDQPEIVSQSRFDFFSEIENCEELKASDSELKEEPIPIENEPIQQSLLFDGFSLFSDQLSLDSSELVNNIGRLEDTSFEESEISNEEKPVTQEVTNEHDDTLSKEDMVHMFQNCLQSPVRGFADVIRAVAENKHETELTNDSTQEPDDPSEKNAILSTLASELQSPLSGFVRVIESVANTKCQNINLEIPTAQNHESQDTPEMIDEILEKPELDSCNCVSISEDIIDSKQDNPSDTERITMDTENSVEESSDDSDSKILEVDDSINELIEEVIINNLVFEQDEIQEITDSVTDLIEETMVDNLVFEVDETVIPDDKEICTETQEESLTQCEQTNSVEVIEESTQELNQEIDLPDIIQEAEFDSTSIVAAEDIDTTSDGTSQTSDTQDNSQTQNDISENDEFEIIDDDELMKITLELLEDEDFDEIVSEENDDFSSEEDYTLIGFDESDFEDMEIEESEDNSDGSERTIIDFASLDVDYQEVELNELDFDSIISKLVEKIAANRLIGYDLLQLAGNDELKERIHAKAKEYLKINYRRSASNLYVGRGEIVISLILIALEHYDGAYWDYVYDEYEDFYEPRSKQKIDAMIRRILAYYSNGENRYINYVIRHAITPKHFIKDFISFVFDIYEETFKCELIDGNNAMNEILSNIFIDVSNKYENANGTFGTNAKTYKLIKTTQEIIDNIEWFGELIAYTKLILKYIDSYYWNETDANLPFRDFFDPFFEDWISENRYKFIERESSNREKTQWQATYRLDRTNVILHIPNYLMKKEYDPQTVVIEVENDGEILNRFERPRTVSVVGGYLVSGFDVKIKKPIGAVKYNIYAGKTLLYSSNSKLYREYLFFSDTHKELKQNSKYSGNVDIVGTDIQRIENISYYYRDEHYCIGNLFLNEYDSIIDDGKPIFVPLVNEEKVFGDLIPQVVVKSYHNEFEVYRNIKGIVFVSEDIKDGKLDLQVNGRHHHLREYSKTQLGNKYVYRVPLEKYMETGFNFIKINNLQSEKTVYSKSLFLSPEYSAHFSTVEDKIKLKIECSLVEGNEFISDMSSDDLFRLPIESQYFDRKLVLVPSINIPVYRIDKNEWKLFKTDFSIKEVNVYSKIWLKGIDFSSISYLASDGKTLVSMNAIEVQHQKYLPCDQIKQFEAMNFTFANLLFYKDNLVVDLVRVYYRSELDKKSLSISYSQDNGVSIKFAYFGDDPVNVSLFKGDTCAFSYDFDQSPVELLIKDVEVFTPYKFVVTGGENDLFSLNSEQYKMYEKEVVFYDEDGILGRTFKVERCRFETYVRGRNEWAEGYRNLRKTRIVVNNKIDENTYSGKLIHSKEITNETMDVELLVTTEISGGNFWGSISSEGDLLLLNYGASTVVFNEDENTKNCVDILEYKFSFWDHH